MNPINPDDEKDLEDFYREWASCYTPRNPVEPPSIVSMRILFQYYVDGSIPGEYISSLLQNDLYGAISSITMEEVPLIYGTMQYMLVRLPCEAYGNPEKYGKWLNKKKKESTSGRKTKYY